MDPSDFTSHVPPPFMYNFMQVPSSVAHDPWARTQRDDSQLPRSAEQLKEIINHRVAQFWKNQRIDVNQPKSAGVYKQHPLPLARIKRVMKSDEDVKMVGADTPVLFAKACELFISELALRSYVHAEDQMRLTIRRCDVANAIYGAQELDFLTDIVPPEARLDIGGDFNLEANMVSLRNMHGPEQYPMTQAPATDGNYIICRPPPTL